MNWLQISEAFLSIHRNQSVYYAIINIMILFGHQKSIDPMGIANTTVLFMDSMNITSISAFCSELSQGIGIIHGSNE